MSQIYKSSASGPPPPAVPTDFVTQNGTAVPALNILLVNGFDSVENNANGIITKGGVVGTGTSNELDIVLTNRIRVTATTSDGAGQTQTVTLMTPTNATVINFECVFVGYDAINDEGCGGDQNGLSRKSAGTVTIIGINDDLDQSDPGLVSVDWNVIATGGDLEAQFVGVAGRTIVWSATFTYDQTP